MDSISDLELESMRSTLSDVLTTDVEVYRRTSTVDPGGGSIDTWTKVHDYKCLFYGTAGVERQTPNSVVLTVTDFTFTFAIDADINQQDHLVVGVRTFNVESVGGATDGIAIGLYVRANEIV